MSNWIAFWDSHHAIYVSAHHRDVHYLRIAEDISRYVPKDGIVLDYGCGDALHAEVAAAPAKRLVLCEAAPNLRDALAARFVSDTKILVVSPDQAAEFNNQSFDLIVMHSVAQYLTGDDLDELLMLFHRLLKEDGHLVLGDIIPPQVSAFTDVIALLRFARADGFFFAALFGLVRTVFSNYWALRTTLGLSRYGKEEMLTKLTHAGFWATVAYANIGHNQARKAYLGRLTPAHS
jgi:SAM-dependent methyltransferase